MRSSAQAQSGPRSTRLTVMLGGSKYAALHRDGVVSCMSAGKIG